MIAQYPTMLPVILWLSLQTVSTQKATAITKENATCLRANMYTGHLNVTKSGLPCQAWSSQHPHEHVYNRNAMFKADGTTAAANNYCRDPGDHGYVWCYTTDPVVKWETCDLETCAINKASIKYTGTASVTKSGRKCQAWASQTPHLHFLGSRDWEFPDSSIKEANNYCRDPDYSGELWCYTTDPDVRWEYCQSSAEVCIPPSKYMGTLSTTVSGRLCQAWSSQTPHSHSMVDYYFVDGSKAEAKNYCRDPEDTGCTLSTKYTGSVNKTISGRTCQAWSSHTPHFHDFAAANFKFPEGSVEDASNFCRDPTNTGYTWCYTTDADKRFERCNVDLCGCTMPYKYLGSQSTTRSGRQCQPWTLQSPHEHSVGVNDFEFPDGSVDAVKNYCRDPSSDGYLWCYTTDPGVRWEPCFVNLCACSGFQCSTGDICIDSKQRCDGEVDCPDNSDERNCGSCAPEADVFHCPAARMCLPNVYHCTLSPYCDIDDNVPLC